MYYKYCACNVHGKCACWLPFLMRIVMHITPIVHQVPFVLRSLYKYMIQLEIVMKCLLVIHYATHFILYSG